MAFLSIIVPVYNSEKYLADALEAIRQQSFTDWECIIVNDGSTDGSQDVIDRYCALDSRFVGYVKPNTRCANLARQYGLSKAKTEFITNIDSDDSVERDYLQKLVKRQNETNADCVVGRLVGCEEELEGEGYYVPPIGFDTSQIISGRNTFGMTIGNWGLPGCACVLYRLSLINKVSYGDAINYDELTSRQVYYYSNSVAFTDARYYYRANSGTSESVSAYSFTRLDVDRALEEFVLVHYPDVPEMHGLMARQRLFNLIWFAGRFQIRKNNYSPEEQENILNRLKNAYLSLNKPATKTVLPKHYCMTLFGWPLFSLFSTIYVRLKGLMGKTYYYR